MTACWRRAVCAWCSIENASAVSSRFNILEIKDWACHLPLQGEEAAPIVNDCVDLTPYVREDILLSFPQHPLCDRDCRGLPAAQQGKAKTGSGAGQAGV